MRYLPQLATAFLFVVLNACGGSSAPPTTPPPPTGTTYTFTISTSGVSPKELTVPQGTRILFINNDNRRRNMTADPHPEHNDPGCEGINNVGLLNAGQSRETGNMVTVRTCGFHDHDDATNANVRGRIIVR